MSVLVLGLNHKSVSVPLLERIAVPPERLPKALASLMARDHVLEAAVLSTCNRVEVYANVTRYHGGVADLRNFVAEWSGLAPEEFLDRAYDYHDDGAAAHLFAVASGLDSMVVGERQIHLQVRGAYRAAAAEGAAGRVLGTLFRQAIRAGKRARAETAISEGASSMVDVALGAAAEDLSSLEGRTVLLVGAGKVGGMAARRLRDVAGRILVHNRSDERAHRLATAVAGEVLPPGALRAGLAAADLVVASSGSPHPLISAGDVSTALASRPGRPLVIIDLAVPRDVEPAAADLAGVTVVDVDTIRSAAASGTVAAEAARARAIVEEEAASFAAWRRSVGVEPTITALRDRADGIRQAELERFARRLGRLDDRDRAAVEALTRRIVNTLLHDPTVRLKALADAERADLHAEALRELFDLE